MVGPFNWMKKKSKSKVTEVISDQDWYAEWGEGLKGYDRTDTHEEEQAQPAEEMTEKKVEVPPRNPGIGAWVLDEKGEPILLNGKIHLEFVEAGSLPHGQQDGL
jgi:hypothetical protein